MPEDVRWEAVGPFPSGMREQPFMASPLHAFPHKHEDPDIDFALRRYGEGDWPSELPTGGRAGWRTFTEADGEVVVSYPEVRWAQLRADHGWASLQYSVDMRRPFTVPKGDEELTRVSIDAFQAVEYAFVPREGADSPVTWFAGDVYAFGETRSGRATEDGEGMSAFAREIRLKPGEYVLLVRAVYECRMFGDPEEGPPEIKVRMRFAFDQDVQPAARMMPDVLDGWIMGAWGSIDVGRRNDRQQPQEGSTTYTMDSTVHGVRVRTAAPVTVHAGLTRAVAFRLEQSYPLDPKVTSLQVHLETRVEGKTHYIQKQLYLHHVSSGDRKPFHLTFASPAAKLHAPAFVSGCTVVPPSKDHDSRGSNSNSASPPPVLLALHGAGVDYRASDWIEAMPRIPGVWAVLPSGRTEWGEDWHGGSMLDAWAARDALTPALRRARITVSSETVLIGHSNGGQGAWHLAARYPDRIRGIIAVAGYLKIQDYVPYTETTSGHYADPSLLGVLHSALAPYNNDLYASNLASVPVLAVHGADDDNVPPRHGRSHAAIVAAWAGEADVRFVEVPHVGHVWDGVLRHPAITHFLTHLPPMRGTQATRDAGFTLTTANPDETGAKAGIRILEVGMPGRLARLDVNAPQWRDDRTGPLDLHGMNVRKIEVAGYLDAAGDEVEAKALTFADGQWNTSPPGLAQTRSYGPMIRLLASAGPVTVVLGARAPPRHWSIARRYAHDLRTYHRLDAGIMDDKEALSATARGGLSPGSVVVLGRPGENRYADWLVAQERVPLEFPVKGVFRIGGRLVWERGTGVISLHPHPLGGAGLAVIVAGNDELGLELAARLLPLRTGVPVPDWCVVSPRMRWRGAGGLVGAGFWGADWEWSEGMSWMDRE